MQGVQGRCRAVQGGAGAVQGGAGGLHHLHLGKHTIRCREVQAVQAHLSKKWHKKHNKETCVRWIRAKRTSKESGIRTLEINTQSNLIKELLLAVSLKMGVQTAKKLVPLGNYNSLAGNATLHYAHILVHGARRLQAEPQ